MNEQRLQAHIEWLNNPWTREQEKAIAHFIDRMARLQEAVISGSREGLKPGDLDYREDVGDIRYVIFTIPREVWNRYGQSEDAIREQVIASAPETEAA